MVLPAPVYAIKSIAAVQGTLFLVKGAKDLKTLTRSHTSTSGVIPSTAFLAYRTLCLAACLAIGGSQLAERGTVVFTYFTVWNWWLLTTYFLISTLCSIRFILSNRRIDAVSGRTRSKTRKGGGVVVPSGSADWLDKSAVTLFHVAVPMSLVVTSMTWLVLVPMLMSNPDPVKVEFWRRLMFCGTSYMQHGGNAAMVLVDLALNSIPPSISWAAGCASIWTTAFGIWSTIFFIYTGSFIYPFLDAHKPYAWIAYLGLFSIHWLFVLFSEGLMYARESLLLRRRRLAAEAAAAPATGSKEQ